MVKKGKKRKKEDDSNKVFDSTSSNGSLTDNDMDLDDINKIIGATNANSRNSKTEKIIGGTSTDTKGGKNIKNNQDANTKERYLPSDKGPFFVTLVKDGINDVLVGRDLIKKNIRGIIEILKVGKNSIRIRCSNYKFANKILEDRRLQNNECNYKIYIPLIYTTSIGIVRNIPMEIEMEEILKYIECDCNVVDAVRMNFWDKEAQVSKPSYNIKITFRSFKIPLEVVIFKAKMKVNQFIPRPLFCKKCLKYGHTINYCENKPKCVNCGSEDHSENCISDKKCIYCKEATD